MAIIKTFLGMLLFIMLLFVIPTTVAYSNFSRPSYYKAVLDQSDIASSVQSFVRDSFDDTFKQNFIAGLVDSNSPLVISDSQAALLADSLDNFISSIFDNNLFQNFIGSNAEAFVEFLNGKSASELQLFIPGQTFINNFEEGLMSVKNAFEQIIEEYPICTASQLQQQESSLGQTSKQIECVTPEMKVEAREQLSLSFDQGTRETIDKLTAEGVITSEDKFVNMKDVFNALDINETELKEEIGYGFSTGINAISSFLVISWVITIAIFILFLLTIKQPVANKLKATAFVFLPTGLTMLLFTGLLSWVINQFPFENYLGQTGNYSANIDIITASLTNLVRFILNGIFNPVIGISIVLIIASVAVILFVKGGMPVIKQNSLIEK